MKKLRNLEGQRFGKLIVTAEHEIRKASKNANHKGTFWLCQCDCGNQKWIRANSLLGGRVTSCNCGKGGAPGSGPPKLPYGESSKRCCYRRYKEDAKKRKISFEITYDQFLELTKKDCYYCGQKPNNIFKSRIQNGDFIYQGIDRINNLEGYVFQNCVPCCKICNRAKDTMTIGKFAEWIIKVYQKFNSFS